MALQPAILNQFKQVTNFHGLQVNNAGLNSLIACVNGMDEGGVDRVLPYVLPLLEGLQAEIKSNTEKTRITNLVAELSRVAALHGADALAQKKRLLNLLLADKTIQDCLMEQLALMKAKSKAPGQFFAQKAFGDLMQKFNHDVIEIGKRNALDPLGMHFDHFFSLFGLMLDAMMEKMGIVLPQAESAEPTALAPENNPVDPRFMKLS